jgi:hypothetical protein
MAQTPAVGEESPTPPSERPPQSPPPRAGDPEPAPTHHLPGELPLAFDGGEDIAGRQDVPPPRAPGPPLAILRTPAFSPAAETDPVPPSSAPGWAATVFPDETPALPVDARPARRPQPAPASSAIARSRPRAQRTDTPFSAVSTAVVSRGLVPTPARPSFLAPTPTRPLPSLVYLARRAVTGEEPSSGITTLEVPRAIADEVRGVTSAFDGRLVASQSTAAPGMPVAIPQRAAAMPLGIARALDTGAAEAQMDTVETASTMDSAEAASEGGAAQDGAEEINLEMLARQVYDQLRARLVVERERGGLGSGLVSR